MVTLTTANDVLKEVYLGVVANQINTNVNPLLAKIEQTTSDVWGKEIRKVAPIGLNGGVGSATEDGALPVAGANSYKQFALTLKNLFGRIDISDKAIRASQSSAGAFVNLLNSEMDGLIKAAAFNFGRMLYGDGIGFLCKVVSNTATYFVVDSVRNLAEGMIIDVIDSDGTAVGNVKKIRITAIDRANKYVYTTKTGMTVNYFASSEQTPVYMCVQDSFMNELTGLGAVMKSTGNLYGLSKSTYNWLVPYAKDIQVNSANTDITDVKIQSVIDKLDEDYGSKVDFIVCSSGVKRDYQSYLASYRSNVNVLDLVGGYKAISYNGIPVVSDRFMPANTMYLLNTKDLHLHQLCDWRWLEGEDGKVLKQNAGYATYTATLVKYADLICDKPCGQAQITGIAEA